MADVNTIFNKTTPTCSNAFLIDQTFCLSNSLQYINSNFNTLSSAIESIEDSGDYFNSVYTVFANSSSAWLGAFNNVKTYASRWNNDYNLVNSLSSGWANEFAIYYNKMYEIQDWIQTSATYISHDVINWINLNFPVNNFAPQQVISVYVNVYENFEFDLTDFQAYYYNDCHLTGAGASGTATGCTTDCPVPGGSNNCNHHGGAAGYGNCDNYLLHCGTSTAPQTKTYQCTPDSGAGTIIIPANKTPYSQIETDTFTARAIKLRYYIPTGTQTWALTS